MVSGGCRGDPRRVPILQILASGISGNTESENQLIRLPKAVVSGVFSRSRSAGDLGEAYEYMV